MYITAKSWTEINALKFVTTNRLTQTFKIVILNKTCEIFRSTNDVSTEKMSRQFLRILLSKAIPQTCYIIKPPQVAPDNTGFSDCQLLEAEVVRYREGSKYQQVL